MSRTPEDAPHRIRLGPPWESTGAPGGALHTRRFGRPRTLGPDERVWLVIGPLGEPTRVSVNGTPVGDATAEGGLEADITSLLHPRNELVIEAPGGDAPAGVALEIRRA